MHNKKSKQTLNTYGKTGSSSRTLQILKDLIVTLHFVYSVPETPGYLRVALLISSYNLLSD